MGVSLGKYLFRDFSSLEWKGYRIRSQKTTEICCVSSIRSGDWASVILEMEVLPALAKLLTVLGRQTKKKSENNYTF